MPIPASLPVFGILLFLLPGFICSLMLRQIIVRAKQTDFEKVVEALVFSFLIYLLSIPFFGNTLPVSWRLNSDGYAIHLHWLQLVVLLIEAAVVSSCYGAAAQHDLLHKFLRGLKMTEKTSRASIWNDVLQDIKNTYLMVELKDGRRIAGYLTYYSDEAEDSSLFLEDAAWVGEDGEQVTVDGTGILITKEAGSRQFHFLTPNAIRNERCVTSRTSGS
jgi:small nuclear ribonucleoprotein (snRNP)-like protein